MMGHPAFRNAAMFRLLSCAALLALAACARGSGFTLQVDDTRPEGRMAPRYSYDHAGCGGRNLAPALHWQGQPPATRSFALTVFDPDAPTGNGFWHWAVLDLPASASGLPEGGTLPPPARAIRNDYGVQGWGGPCPPVGDRPHHYVFTLYALDVPRLDLPPDVSPVMAGSAMRDHAIGMARETLTFGR